MASTVLKVPEKGARKLLKELNLSSTGTPKKLEKALVEVRESMNGDSVEDMDLTNQSKSLLDEIIEAVDDEKTLKIVSVDTEDEGEEEEAPKGKKKSAKVKTEKKPKTQKKSSAVAAKGKKKKSGSSSYNPETAAVYQQKLKKEGQRIEKAIASGPKSVATIAAKAGVTESRVNSFMNYYNRNRKTPMYEIVKGKVRSNKE